MITVCLSQPAAIQTWTVAQQHALHTAAACSAPYGVLPMLLKLFLVQTLPLLLLLLLLLGTYENKLCCIFWYWHFVNAASARS